MSHLSTALKPVSSAKKLFKGKVRLLGKSLGANTTSWVKGVRRMGQNTTGNESATGNWKLPKEMEVVLFFACLNGEQEDPYYYTPFKGVESPLGSTSAGASSWAMSGQLPTPPTTLRIFRAIQRSQNTQRHGERATTT